MVYLLSWLASFFTMASFWRYLGFGWSTWKEEDFLQVQSEHCKRLHIVIPRLEKCWKDMEASSEMEVLNKNQCIHLFGKLILAMKGIEKMLSSATGDLKFQSIFEELCCLQRKVEIVGENCIDQNRWCRLVVFQLQSKETFRELLLDLRCCYDTARDVYLFHHPNRSNNILPIQFDAATYKQVLEDGEVLKRKLELICEDEVSQDYELAQHLLLRLRNLDRVDGGDLDALEIPNDIKTPELIQKIGEGYNGYVYKSNWFGLTCATEVLTVESGNFGNSQKEAGILAGLSHPNLVQFLGCGITPNVDAYPMEDESVELHLVMELMESSLSQILKSAKGPLSYILAIDIMHQIAKGVYYLHDMQVAHLDLKPDNVLSSSIPMEDLAPHCIFKVTDYGTCQLEVLSNPKNPEPSKYTIGTLGYMSPETIKDKKPLYPFRADVWSFAMMCSEILSRKVPYSDLKPREFHDKISSTYGSSSKGLRPDLPNNCEELTNLIQECWSQDPRERPTFSEICERLTSLKKSFLKGTYSCKTVPQFGSLSILRNLEPTVDHVPKVDEPIAPPTEVHVDLEHQLSKAKELLKLKYLGIVGMGGIGKTTLAKAIFDDAIVKSSYHASCFVTQSKNNQSSYEILCKILPKLGKYRKSKNLGDAQKMMKEFLFKNKVLLILDDVKDEALVHDIVPPDIVQASKGTTIIITTRKWNTIKSFVGNEGRLDVESLDTKAATTLFTTHLSWGVACLSPDFGDLRDHVVKACNGLPLSLKVIGSFLHDKERLRSWERALQRMARGRNLDGDEQIWNTLKSSYDGLNEGIEKGMFLDMACFFCKDVCASGISKETLLYMWSKDGILPVDELQRLINTSLLKVSEDGDILEMHDQLRDMGRMIAEGTRIWKASMIPEKGFTSKDVKVLEGISWQGNMNQHLPLIKQDQSVDFKSLRVLMVESTLVNSQAHFDHFDLLLQFASQCSSLEAIIIGNSNAIKLLPKATIALNIIISNLCSTLLSLKILDLKGVGFLEQLPNKFASRNILLRLNMNSCSNLVALPQEVGNFSSLTILDLSGCSSLVALPKEVGKLSSLTTLNLHGCSSLAVLPKEVGNLSSLTSLDLTSCFKLVALPKEVSNLSSLTTLNFFVCAILTALPKEVENLSSMNMRSMEKCSCLVALPQEKGHFSLLTTLNLWGCSSLSTLPKEVGNWSFSTTLNFEECLSLAPLPNQMGNLFSFTSLDLKWCSKLVALPVELGNLSSLTTLNLYGCTSLAALPKEVGNLTSLIIVNLYGCASLAALPKEVGNLSSLTTLHLRRCTSLVALPKEVGNLSSLTTLNLNECSKLAALPREVENLSSLIALNLGGCASLAALPVELGNLSSLTTLDLHGCSSLATLPKEIANLSSLTTLDLDGCISLEALPKEVGNLSFLPTLNLYVCSSLAALPKEVGNLNSLTTLNLGKYANLTTLPKEVGNLSSLTTLDLAGCSSLVALPKEVGNLSSLTIFNLRGCSSLAVLPKEVENLSSLITLDLARCSNLTILPKEVGNLSSLTTLDLAGCSSLVALPKEVGNLSSLTTFNLRRCSSLAALPMEVGNLTSLTTLNLRECLSLVALPKEVGNLSSLTTLNLAWCLSLVALPKEVGNLSSLTTFNLRRCSSLVALPMEVGNLSSLTTLDLRGCSRNCQRKWRVCLP